MRRVWSVFCLVIAAAVFLGPAAAQSPSELKPRPDIILGQLDNGMRYAILPSRSPPGLMSMRFHIAAGSMHEKAGQEGMAHMLEHLAFRGSKNIPGPRAIWDRYEQLGLMVGGSVNAMTAPHETIYMADIAGVTTDKASAVLDIYREVASELDLSKEGMEAERGIVLAEERTRDTPHLRQGEALIHAAFEGQGVVKSPIGVVDTLQTASVERVREFYQAYYRPERATLIVVGPGDPKAIERGIRERFSTWRGRGAAGKDPPPVTERTAERLVLHTRANAPKEAALVWVKPGAAGPDTLARRQSETIDALATAIVQDRLSRLPRPASGNPRPSFGISPLGGIATMATLSVGPYLDIDDAVASLLPAQHQAFEAPVTAEELNRVSTRMRDETRRVAQSPFVGTRVLVGLLLTDLTTGRVPTAMTDDLAALEGFLGSVTPQQVDASLKRLLPATPLVFVSAPEAPAGGEAAIRAALAKGRNDRSPITQQAATKAWPYESFGPPGRVVERREESPGLTFVRFANNVRLTVKPSNVRDDQILVRVAFGNGPLDFPVDKPAARLWNSAYLQGGLVGLTNIERRNLIEARNASLTAGQTEDAFYLGGSTRKADLDFQLQLLAASMTAPAWQPETFESTKNQMLQSLNNSDATPDAVFSSQALPLLGGGDTRLKPLTREAIAAATVQDIRAFLDPILASSDIEIVMVGTITPEDAINAVAKTFGALAPRAPGVRPSGAPRMAFPAPTDRPLVLSHKGRSDQGLASITWPTTGAQMSDTERVSTQVLAAIFNTRMTDELREAQGKTYAVGGGLSLSDAHRGYGSFMIQAQTPPDALGAFYKAADEIAAELRTRGPTADEVDLMVRTMRRQAVLPTRTDIYWLTALMGVQRDPKRLDQARNPVVGIDGVTADSVKAVAQRWLAPDKAYRISVAPAGDAQAPAPGLPATGNIRFSQAQGR